VKHEASSLELDPARLTAGQIMTTDIACAKVGDSVRAVAKLLSERRVSAIPVLADDDQLVGMVSEGDLLGRDAAGRLARSDWWLALLKGEGGPAAPTEAMLARPVSEVMHAPVVTVGAQASLPAVAEMLRLHDIKRLPVMSGGHMVGIVSRSDIVRAMGAGAPPPSAAVAPAGGLLGFLSGMMQRDVRPEDPSAAAPSQPKAPTAPAATADAFRSLVTASKETIKDDAAAAREQGRLERGREVKALLMKPLREPAWTVLVERAHAAAALGETSFELIRFPCDLCADGGRMIDVAEVGWPATLRGEPAEMYTRWEREMKPQGFGLNAQIVEYLDGIPSKVALTLTWNPPE
jgi:CBS domain-containing protein